MLAKQSLQVKLLIALVVLGMGLALISYLSPAVEAEAESENELKKAVAYVNIEKIFENHPHKEETEIEFNKKVEELRSDLAADLELELKEVSGEDRQKLVQSYEQQLRNRITQKEEELLDSLMKEIHSTVEKIGAEKEVAVILEEDSVLYGGHNLTEAVIERLEAKVAQD
ncbi:OmpH family outer membrane protein [Fuchsiella alkaliacetigena]|uniref:OmpH family outer membrane protein n=1 Tax=Fuchsiella alkaliacetigena TaxID=957042 RepID=UPI00200A84C6|nr:OmpH family outer membrane protein [Fuchsiella alkaliacetigena]MCK8824565.1 OmpH family outer membrane protein [Fuchsiella alkaliacetigena]